jgi:hypothetical protein
VFLESGVEFAWGIEGIDVGELNDLFEKVGGRGGGRYCQGCLQVVFSQVAAGGGASTWQPAADLRQMCGSRQGK